MAKLRYRSNRIANRYFVFRHYHFLPGEARELKQLHRLDYRETRIMVSQRVGMWKEFRHNASPTWSPAMMRREWVSHVRNWYERSGFVAKSFFMWRASSQKNVWLWFDAVSKTLPEEERYSKGGRRKGDNGKDFARAARVMETARNQQFIEGLKRTVLRHPERDDQLTKQARRLGWKGSSLLRDAGRDKK